MNQNTPDSNLRHTLLALAIAGGCFWFRCRKNKIAQSIQKELLQEKILQKYLDRMTTFLLDSKIHDQVAGEQTRNLARTLTLTTLARLEPARKGIVLNFLYEGGLIGGGPPSTGEPLVHLRYANLREAQLPHANLGWAEIVAADLTGANLRGAFLAGANLGGADLIDADLSGATLTGTNLILADLRGCNLQGADLADVLVTPEQLSMVKKAADATSPTHVTRLDIEK